MTFSALDIVKIKSHEGAIRYSDQAWVVSVDPGAPEKPYLCVDNHGKYSWYQERELVLVYKAEQLFSNNKKTTHAHSQSK